MKRKLATIAVAFGLIVGSAPTASALAWQTTPRHHDFWSAPYAYDYAGHSAVWRSPNGTRMCTDSHLRRFWGVGYQFGKVVTTGHHPC